MLTLPVSDAKTLCQISQGIFHANVRRNSLVFHKSFESKCLSTLPLCNGFFNYSGHISGRLLLRTSKQFHLQIRASSDEEYGSSRNIAVSLFRRYRNVIDRGGSDNLKEFIDAGVNAYALGCTDESLRRELLDMKNFGEGLQPYGGGTNVTCKIVSDEVRECILWLSIVFITILCTPQPTIVRWSSTSPVSTEIMHQWKGFCALIANAYFKRGMAWLPVKTLQLEQMAVLGCSEEASVVASRMRLVFTTLERLSCIGLQVHLVRWCLFRSQA
ncbi:uncharacterized protein LOC110018360 [Phalaenopsis equestris]|uniref:uncharacterized protein LOC110018360 n=1 Tax=Phalaenopsis equestris TaxID=78828 RepID=UPI0009E63F68|nr:uncharacterized protein LOC110018360 [Phalaenopsis equestris]